MKVAEPEVIVTMSSPVSDCQRHLADSTAEFETICNLQLEQLATQIPMATSWVVYQDWAKETREWVVYQTHVRLAFDPVAIAYLESQEWLRDEAAHFQVQEVAIAQLSHTYLCRLDHQEGQPEYLLIWATERLSLQHTQAIERCARLIHPYLDLCRRSWRQQAEVRLMEQVVQRVEHQLRNPLALISLYAENLLHQLQPGVVQDQVTVIRDTVTTLAANLKGLVGCGQRAYLHIGIYDLREVLESSIRGLQPWLDVKQLQVGYPDVTVFLSIDRWQIRQVLDNLLSNAIHFSPVGGSITCHWQLFQQEALITIRDQGPGLTSTDLERLFTPFYSRRPGGTGLGLAIAKKIVLDHRGNLWADNVPGSGAQFSISLPR